MMTNNLSEKAELLSKSILFSQLASTELDRLVRFTKVKKAKAKEIIFHKGDEGNQLFAILNGKIQISTISEHGKEITLSILDSGDIFGDISVFDNRERTANATAIEVSDLLVIEKRDFIPFLKDNAEIAIKIISALCQRIRVTDEMMEDLMFRNIPARLAKKLISLCHSYGVENETGIQIDLKLSQTELGNLVNTSRESVNKQMKLWEEQKLLSFRRGYITLHNVDSLYRIIITDS